MGYTAGLRDLKPPKGYRFLKIGEYIPVGKAKVLAAGTTWTSVKAMTKILGVFDPRVRRWHYPFAVPVGENLKGER